jgi:hypothetical protein
MLRIFAEAFLANSEGCQTMPETDHDDGGLEPQTDTDSIGVPS